MPPQPSRVSLRSAECKELSYGRNCIEFVAIGIEHLALTVFFNAFVPPFVHKARQVVLFNLVSSSVLEILVTAPVAHLGKAAEVAEPAKAVIKHTLRQPSLLVGPASLLDGVLIFYGELLGPWKSEDRSFFSFRTKTVKLGWRRGVNVEEVSPVVQESLPHPSGTRRDNGDIGLLVG